MSETFTPQRVLMIRSNPVAPDPRVEKIARALYKQGHKVSILAWGYHGTDPAAQHTDEYNITRLGPTGAFGRGLGNLPRLFLWQLNELGWLLRHRHEYDILHACDFDTVLPALLVRSLFRKKLIYDIFDYYADMLRRTPGWLQKFIRRCENWIIEQADGIILVDENRRAQIAPAQPKRMAFIYNAPEEPDALPDFPVQHLPQEELSLVYVGLLQYERGLDTLLTVLQKHSGWRLELAGEGADREEITTRAAALQNVHFHGRVEYNIGLALGSSADVFSALYDPDNPNHRFASPNKVFEAMLLGKPVIVAENTNVDALIREWDCGLVVDYHNPATIEAALTRLAEDQQLRARLGQNARKAYDQRFSWKQMEAALQNLYEQITLF